MLAMYFVSYFAETKHWTVLESISLGQNAANCRVGTKINLVYPVRRQPFEAVIRGVTATQDEAEKLLEELAGSCVHVSPNPPDEKKFVTADLFASYMCRILKSMEDMQSSSAVRLDKCVTEMTKMIESINRDKYSANKNVVIESPDMTIAQTSRTMAMNKVQQVQKLANPPVVQPIQPPPRWATVSSVLAGGPPIIEEDIGRPTWEFVLKEKVDEVFEDSDNYKIFARKISYAIFDETEQKLKLNERNKKKVSELRKIIKLKYGSDRREFDDMIWRTCKNAVNNTTYNEAKRRKRHHPEMMNTPELITATGETSLATLGVGSGSHDNGGTGPSTKHTHYSDDASSMASDMILMPSTNNMKTEPISELSGDFYQEY